MTAWFHLCWCPRNCELTRISSNSRSFLTVTEDFMLLAVGVVATASFILSATEWKQVRTDSLLDIILIRTPKQVPAWELKMELIQETHSGFCCADFGRTEQHHRNL